MGISAAVFHHSTALCKSKCSFLFPSKPLLGKMIAYLKPKVNSQTEKIKIYFPLRWEMRKKVSTVKIPMAMAPAISSVS